MAKPIRVCKLLRRTKKYKFYFLKRFREAVFKPEPTSSDDLITP